MAYCIFMFSIIINYANMPELISDQIVIDIQVLLNSQWRKELVAMVSLLCLHCTLNNTTYCIDLHHIHGYNDLGQHLNSFKQLKIWNNTLLIIMKMIKKWLDCIEHIINLIGIYDPLVIPTCYGSLFQELVNLSHVIDRKGENDIVDLFYAYFTCMYVCVCENELHDTD
ncbi:Receptor-type tyrosine-protein phosphatase F [Schistosoma japonicum]|nr:Receptor-type tyrosine-protein phosphatase F [Schistosoma japonicum]